MKSKKKVLVTLLCAALLVFASVMGTMAYLQDKETVTNTFSVGKVDIAMDEAKVDEYGVPITGEGRVKENAYTIIPGHEYTKDPIVYVNPVSEASWVFVKVENGLAAYEAETNKIDKQIQANGWIPLTGQNGVYYKSVDKVAGAVLKLPVFEKFILATNAEGAANGSTIVVNAYAIQADTLDVNAAWATVSAAAQQ